MSFTRRNMLRFGGSTVISAMALSACGGSDGPSDGAVEGDVITSEPALRIENLPDPEPMAGSGVQRASVEEISVKVRFGDQPQESAAVSVYDADGNLLVSGHTDSDGYLRTETPGRQVLFAVAQLSNGENLFGYSYAPDGILCPTINVNAYQTLAAYMAQRLGLEYNVINFLLHRHFAIGFNEEIQSLDTDSAEFSQEKFARAQRESGLSVEAFMTRMADDIIAHRDEEVEPVLDYVPDPAPQPLLRAALPNIDDEAKYKIMEFALNKLEEVTKGFVHFPYSDKVISFFFGKLKGELKPAEPDPLAEVKEKLDNISQKLVEIADYLKKQDLTARWNSMLACWCDVWEAHKDFNTAPSALAASIARDKALALFRNNEFTIKAYNSWFFGGGLIKPENSFLFLYSQYVAELPYYSADVQERIDTYVANFVLRQTEVLNFAMAMITTKNHEAGISEEQTVAELSSLQASLWETERLAELYKAQRPDLPDTRLLFHKATRTLWAGMCGTVETVNDWMPPGYYTRMWHYFGAEWRATGTAPNGVDNEKYMLKSEDNPNGVSRKVLEFAKWRLPSKKLVEEVFTNPAKANKKADSSVKAFDVFAMKNGIPSHFPVRMWQLDKKKLENRFAVIGTTTFVSSASVGFCWDQDFVRLYDYASYRGALSTKYQDGARYGYFPCAEVPDELAQKCDVVRMYNAFHAAAFSPSV